MKIVDFKTLNSRYEDDLTSVVRVEAIVSTEIVGSQPADEPGVKAFVQHHLHLTGKDAEDAVKRILHEEVESVTPELGEIPEGRIYGVRCVRHTKLGPYLGDWQVKAALKQAASTLGIFVEVRGTKKNFAEAGRVRAYGVSAIDKDNPNFIYLRDPSGKKLAETYHKEFMGRVQSPTGPVSIIHHSECVTPGSRFAFDFHFPAGNLKEQDVEDVLAMLMVVGLGGARSLERGKIRIERAEIDLRKNINRKPVKPEKEDKKKGTKPAEAA